MRKAIKNIREWLYWNAPIITTRKQQEEEKKLNQRICKIRLLPTIHSLKELRKNTWDKERVDNAIKWLNEKFWEEK